MPPEARGQLGQGLRRLARSGGTAHGAQALLQAGPHRVVALLSREAADELALAPGVLAVAAVKATNVVVELPAQP